MSYVIKALITVLVVISVTEISKRSPTWGALIISLPFTVMTTMCFLYYDTRDVVKVAEFSRAVVPMIIPSVGFFFAFSFLVELGAGFVMAMALATLIMLGGYSIFLFFVARTGL